MSCEIGSNYSPKFDIPKSFVRQPSPEVQQRFLEMQEAKERAEEESIFRVCLNILYREQMSLVEQGLAPMDDAEVVRLFGPEYVQPPTVGPLRNWGDIFSANPNPELIEEHRLDQGQWPCG